MPGLIDTHCHLDDEQLASDLPDVIAHGFMLNMPCQVETQEKGKYLNVTKVFAARGNTHEA